MVMDYCDLDLQQLLLSESKSNSTCLKDWFGLSQQLARGVSHLAACQVLHRDLHAKNILIQQQPLALTIADLGKAAIGVLSSQCPMTALVYIASARPPEVFFCQGSKFQPDGTWMAPAEATYGLIPLTLVDVAFVTAHVLFLANDKQEWW